jgi:hypothetical protein
VGDVTALTPILNVSDIRASIAWFQLLGWREAFSWPGGSAEPTFGGVCTDKVEIFLCRGAQGSRGERQPAKPGDEGTGGVWMSWWLESAEDVDALHAFAVEHDLDVSMPPTDEPWNVREFHLRHPDGHTFRVGASTVE